MKELQEPTSSVKLLPMLVSAVVAGALGMIVYIGTSALEWSAPYVMIIPLIVAVPFGMLGAYGWDKGFNKLNGRDVLNSLIGGVGVVIGVILIQLLK